LRNDIKIKTLNKPKQQDNNFNQYDFFIKN